MLAGTTHTTGSVLYSSKARLPTAPAKLIAFIPSVDFVEFMLASQCKGIPCGLGNPPHSAKANALTLFT
ncbi:MAG TPA: hypothetical protein V6D33_14880 [Cyanophyceae cyanobacterium]